MKILTSLDKVGALGAALAVAAAPCCFPLLASVGAALGLSFLSRFEPQMAYAVQACVLLAVVGAFFAFRRHKRITPLALAAVGCASVLAFYHTDAGSTWVYFGLVTLAVSGVWNIVVSRGLRRKIQYSSVIACPHCGFKKEEKMPTDSCQFFYECTSCHKMLKPKQGDCCVYCSYGSVPCPPIQAGQGCCA